jgi:hypothetical protein
VNVKGIKRSDESGFSGLRRLPLGFNPGVPSPSLPSLGMGVAIGSVGRGGGRGAGVGIVGTRPRGRGGRVAAGWEGGWGVKFREGRFKGRERGLPSVPGEDRSRARELSR